jgi:hypothetical protein
VNPIPVLNTFKYDENIQYDKRNNEVILKRWKRREEMRRDEMR